MTAPSSPIFAGSLGPKLWASTQDSRSHCKSTRRTGYELRLKLKLMLEAQSECIYIYINDINACMYRPYMREFLGAGFSFLIHVTHCQSQNACDCLILLFWFTYFWNISNIWRFIVWLFSVISWFFRTGNLFQTRLDLPHGPGGWTSLGWTPGGETWWFSAGWVEFEPHITVVTRPMIIAPSMIKIQGSKILKGRLDKIGMDVVFFLMSILGHGDVQNYGCCCFDTFVSTTRLIYCNSYHSFHFCMLFPPCAEDSWDQNWMGSGPWSKNPIRDVYTQSIYIYIT